MRIFCLGDVKFALVHISLYAEFSELSQYAAYMLLMLSQISTIDQDVVQAYRAKLV